MEIAKVVHTGVAQEYDPVINFMRLSEQARVPNRDLGLAFVADEYGLCKFEVDYLYDHNELYLYMDYHPFQTHGACWRLPRWLVMT